MRQGLLGCLLLWNIGSELGAESVAPQKARLEIAVKKDSEMGLGVIAALQKAFTKAGYDVTFEDYPSRRGIEELKNGRVDGSASRVGPVNTIFDIPDIVRLDVPTIILTLSLWCDKSPEKMRLLPKPRVAFFHGSIFAARLIQTVDDKSVEFIDIPSYRNMLSMMEKGRLDCFLGSESTMLADGIAADQVGNLKRHDLITSASYPWINKRLLALKPVLEKELSAYPYAPAWLKKYRAEKPACKDRFDLVCPDGRIFTREQLFSPSP